VPEPQQQDEDDKSWTLCAKVSCVLAIFFPIIGCLAFCLNLDAKKGSQRQKWARRCLATATIMIVLAGLWYLSILLAVRRQQQICDYLHSLMTNRTCW